MRFLRLCSVLCFVAISILSSVPSSAQSACDDCAERYAKIADGKRLQSDIDYLLPSDDLDLDRTKKKAVEGDPEENSREREREAVGNISWFLISAIVLLGIVFVIAQNSTGGLVSFSNKPEEGSKTVKRRGTAEATGPDHNDLPKSDAAFLAGIESMADRRAALHLLSGRLLANAAEKSGIRPGRSWTARESLRALPRNWVHLADLRHINRHAEIAWFGGRQVNDTIFEDCLTRARTMMRGGARAQ